MSLSPSEHSGGVPSASPTQRNYEGTSEKIRATIAAIIRTTSRTLRRVAEKGAHLGERIADAVEPPVTVYPVGYVPPSRPPRASAPALSRREAVLASLAVFGTSGIAAFATQRRLEDLGVARAASRALRQESAWGNSRSAEV